MNSELLSSALFRETRGTGFFRVLAGKNSPFYVDILDSLERECSERPDGIGREEAVALIADTLERHPGIDWEADFAGDPDSGEVFPTAEPSSAPRDRARLLCTVLIRNRWLEEPPRRDWRRTLHLDAHGATMLAALRKIAWPDEAVFTDKITAVCSMLADESSLSERPWQTIETCLANIREGLNELRSMQKSVQRLTRRQLEEETLRGNLAVVFDDYADQISHSCYAALVRSRLPSRLPLAVRRIHDRLIHDAGALGEMQTEVLRRHPEMSPESSRAKVHQSLDELANLLERVLPMADEIDRRTADFTRRSLARFRYLQDVSSERRSEIRRFFTIANQELAGKRISSVETEPRDYPDFRLPSVKLPAGLDSLYHPPVRRTPIEQEPIDDADDAAHAHEGLHAMQQAIRDSLSTQRANRFVASLPGGRGTRIPSSELPIHEPTGLADLIALLLHAEARDACYRLDIPRVEEERTPSDLTPLPGCRVEPFVIVKKGQPARFDPET